MIAPAASIVASGVTGLGKTVLLLVAITFILWALYTAMIVPRRRPEYPRRLDVFIVATVVLFAAQMVAVVWVTGTQAIETHSEEVAGGHGGDDEGDGEAPPAEEEPPPAEEEPPPAEEEPGEAPAGGDAEAGAEVFATAGCGTCHTLADAGSSGAIGPNLDELAPSAEQVAAIVTSGRGAMPSFSGQLDEQQIEDVAAYVATVAGA